MTNAANATIEPGLSIVIDGEILTIESTYGRWVKLSNGKSIGRAAAQEARDEYLEDAETLGDELDSEDDEEITGEPSDDLDENGNVIPEDEDESDDEEESGYQGSMIRLRERLAEGAYQKAPNGQPCCGDQVATLLGTLAPAQVIRACIIAMALPANPYNHLNVGQQSMNLRNKLRGCFKREEFGLGVLVEAVEEVREHDKAISLAVAATQAAKYEAQAAAE